MPYISVVVATVSLVFGMYCGSKSCSGEYVFNACKCDIYLYHTAQYALLSLSHLSLSPYYLLKYAVWYVKWVWKYQIHKGEYTTEDAVYVTRKQLKLTSNQWKVQSYMYLYDVMYMYAFVTHIPALRHTGLYMYMYIPSLYHGTHKHQRHRV